MKYFHVLGCCFPSMHIGPELKTKEIQDIASKQLWSDNILRNFCLSKLVCIFLQAIIDTRFNTPFSESKES